MTSRGWLAVAVACGFLSTAAGALESDQLPANALAGKKPKSGVSLRSSRASVGQGHTNSGPKDVDSLPLWNGHFRADGLGPQGESEVIWYYTMIGNRSELGGTTVIDAPIIPVSVDLRNEDGSPRFVDGVRLFSDATQFVQPVVDSPVFQSSTYSSSLQPTQFGDAILRAEFFRSAKADWHTLLRPIVRTPRTIVLNRGTYTFSLNDDGSCCFFITVDIDTFSEKMLPFTADDTTTPMGQAERAGEITNQDLSIFLLPNTYVTEGDFCCFTGFHTHAPQVTDQLFLIALTNWITPGVFFSDAAQDVNSVSHEVTEDVIENTSKEAFPIVLDGRTWHPANSALLQWFARESPSSAIGGAYSYPDTTALTALSPPQPPFCQ
jgi:hypothetical protein